MKITLYPKTKRVGSNQQKIVITEKLDGSNIGFFRLEDDLIIAQRNNVYKLSEIKSDKLYKGLFQWLSDNGEDLKNRLHPNSGFFAEWIGMGRLKYGEEFGRVHIFAKANIKSNGVGLECYNILYDSKLLIYPFVDQDIPDYVKFVPVVAEVDEVNLLDLDVMYDRYTKEVNRDVEGFICIYTNDSIKKYVRMKSGTLEEHYTGKQD